MKHTIIDISELSDSKEVYGQRPNPFIAWFIYSLVALLAAAVIYASVGTIEIVARGTGIVRPNDAVSTISGIVGGRVTAVNYTDGQFVRQGDTLLTVDMSDTEIRLRSLESSREKARAQLGFLDRFLEGIEKGENPFSSDTQSEDYPYYVQFESYLLNLEAQQKSFDDERTKNYSSIRTYQDQVAELTRQQEGMTAYRDSIEAGQNLAGNYPEYANMYSLYESSIAQLRAEYAAGAFVTADVLEQYRSRIEDYELLLSSVDANASLFPPGRTSEAQSLYTQYCTELDAYRRAVELAQAAVDACRADKASEIRVLSMQIPTMTFASAGTEGSPGEIVPPEESQPSESEEPSGETVPPEETQPPESEEPSGENPPPEETQPPESEEPSGEITTPEEPQPPENEENLLSQAEEALRAAQEELENYMASKRAAFAELLENSKAEYAAAEESYNKGQMSLDAAIEQQKRQTIASVDGELASVRGQLITAQSNLRAYSYASELAGKKVDKNGDALVVSLATSEQLASVLNQKENIEVQMEELEHQEEQLREQLAQGTIVAESSGFIHTSATVVSGDVLPAGTVLGTIIPANESAYKVQIYLNSADIGSIEEGDSIHYNITALPSRQYGSISGEVLHISKDVLLQNGQFSGYYLVEGSIDATQIEDKDGNVGKLVIGMETDARIVTQNKTILRYLWEKIDF